MITSTRESKIRGVITGLVIAVAVLDPHQTLAAGPAPVDLGSTAHFTILAGAAISTTGGGLINGDVGASPIAGSAIGVSDAQVNGIIYAVDASGPAGSVVNPTLLTAAKGDLTTAYNAARDRTPVPTGPFLNPGSGNIGGLNLGPGLYKFTGTALITGSDVTLTGGPDDVWIFQIASDLQVGSTIKVILAGGAQAKNIFWQVGTSATIGTFAVFKGTILADQSVTMNTSSAIDGRALAFSAGVTFNGTAIDVPLGSNRTAYDFDGDGVADITVFNPATANWYIQQSGLNNAQRIQNWGTAAMIPVPADYDGDTIADVAVFLPSSGTWYVLQSSNGQILQQQWGWSSGYPVPADYDGDGKADFAVYNRESATWFILQSSNGQTRQNQWGWSAVTPVPGDYDGDGKSDLAVYDPNQDTWYVLRSSNGTLLQRQFGYGATVPEPSDFDGDGITDLAVFDPAISKWFIARSTDGAVVSQQWGFAGATPAAADYDGDGKCDITVYNQATGTWYILRTSNSTLRMQGWGWSAAQPITLEAEINSRINSY